MYEIYDTFVFGYKLNEHSIEIIDLVSPYRYITYTRINLKLSTYKYNPIKYALTV